MSFTIAFAQTTLTSAIVAGDRIHWSSNGSTENANLAPTSIAAWKAATAADPSVRATDGVYESAPCGADGQTITHFAVFNSTGATQKTSYVALTTPRTLNTGDCLSIADGAIAVTLT